MVRSLSALLLASTAIVPLHAQAQSLPSGGSVAAGSAEIGAASGGALTIRQNSDAAIINWQSFDIDRGKRVDIVQPSATATLLNRVTGGMTTTIAGQLNANGRVFVVNPNGILITATGGVKAAGFVGSTLDIDDSDFMAGRYDFSGSSGIVVNAGRIQVARGGYAALLGGKVDNKGLILAPLGKVGMGAGTRATLDFSGDGFLKVAIGAGERAELGMSGRIAADGGTVILSAAQARAAARSTVNLSGVVEARGIDTSAGGVTLTGGDIVLTGAMIDVSGTSGGGSVRIGGDRQGLGDTARADTLRVDAASTIRADATAAGAGGDVVLWSDKATDFTGAISARGVGAKGGEAEVSSKGQLGYGGTADLTGSAFGTLLLDPYNLTISSAPSSGTAGFAANANDSVLNASALTAALATANVTVQTGSNGSQVGNITVSAPLSWSSNATLTLNAASNIALNAAITAQAGGLTLVAGGTISQTGTIAIGRFTLSSGVFGTVAATLPGFEAGSFAVNGGSFVRATGGDGTAATPWLLADVYGLQGMTSLRSSNFALANDVDATGTVNWNGGAGFRPIGGQSGNLFESDFRGTLDGRGYSIRNLYIHQPYYAASGLFVRLTNATIRNLRLTGATIEFGGGSFGRVGGLAAYISGSVVNNVHIDGRITAGGAFGNAGGIAYSAVDSTLSNISLAGTITADNVAAGVAYSLEGTSSVSNAYVTASITGDAAAGVAYGNYDGTSIRSTWVSGVLTGWDKAGISLGGSSGTIGTDVFWDMDTTTANIGFGYGPNGAVGLTTAQARTQAAYAGFDFTNIWFQAADMRPILRSEAMSAGGDGYIPVSTLNQLQLLGANLTANYRLAGDIDAAATNGAAASGIWGSGGFVPIGLGGAFNGNLEGANHAISNLTINRPTTDFVGLISQHRSLDEITIRDLRVVNAAVSGRNATGAVVGSARWNLTNVWASGTVTGAQQAGGIAGEVLGGTLTNLHFDGSVQGVANVGGVTGALAANASMLSATGSVAGTNSVGGISGTLSNLATMSTGFSTSSVIASGVNAGGAVGRVLGGILTNVWASGAVTAVSNAGGVAGSQDAGTTIRNSYWDMTTTGQTTAVGAASGTRTLVTGLTTAQARNPASYANFANFATTWYQGGDMRPILRGEALAASGGTVGVFNARQLQLVNANVAGNYTLLADIDLSATSSTAASSGVWGANGWTPLGSLSNRFTGTLNGANRLVSNLNVANADYAGLFGFSETNASIRDMTVSGTVSGVTAGGLIGSHGGSASLISDVTVNVAVTGTDFAGGLAGRNSATITRSSASGAVVGNDAIAVGGLVGELNTGELSYAFATGSVTTNYIAPTFGAKTGGLIGTAFGRSGAIHDVYATGAVTVNSPSLGVSGSATGGLIGENIGFAANGYSTGQVTDSRSFNVGGLIGEHSGTIANLFWNTQTSGQAVGIGDTLGSAVGSAIGLTTAQMTDLASYATTYAGFDFNSVWVPPNQSGQGGDATAHYPELYGFTNAVVVGAPSRAYGDDNGAFVATYTGLQSRDYLQSPGTLTTAATATSGAGTYAATLTAPTIASLSGRSYRTLLLPATTTLTVTPRAITIAANAQTRVYGNVLGSLTYSVLGRGLVNGDTLSGALATPAVQGSDVGSYAVTQGTLGASTNYAVSYAGADLSITARPITVTADAQSRIYGNANPTLTYAVGGSGLYGSDTLSGALATTGTQPANVGSYGIRRGTLGNANSNYAITFISANLTITARPITVTADAQSRIYGDANPALTYTVGGNGLYGSDSLSGALATTAIQGSDVGGYAIGQGSLAASSNYALTYAGADLSVTARPITVTADAQTRIYGNANPTLTYAIGGSGLYASDTLSGALATAATQGSNVGVYAIGQGALAASSNYALTYIGADLLVTARPITVAADAQSRIYGDANPTLTYTVGGSGLYGSDILSGALATSATQGSNVGSYAITQGTLGTSGNYAVAYTGADLSITARPITVAADAQSRIYGNANPALTYTIGGSGLYGSDTLSGALATAATQRSDVGSYAITLGTLAAQNGNYALTYAGANLSVTARPITVTANAQTRVYGNANPPLTYAIGGSGLHGSDALSGALATAATQSSDVGIYGIGQGTLAAGSNYALTYNGANLSVTARPITVTADAPTRIYGNANAALTYTVGGSGLYGSDTLSGALATAATQSSDVGIYGIGQGTLAAGSNYVLTYNDANLSITARPITVTADAQTRIYGNANAALTYTVGGSGLYGSDALSGALATAATQSSDVGIYGIGQGTLAAGSNYALTYNGANLSVTARPITVTADAQTRIYGNANAALTYTVGGSGLYGSDTLSGALATGAAQGSDVGSYAITQGSLTGGTNYALSYAGAELIVTLRPITVTAAATARIYGDANPALGYAVGGNGLYGSDSLGGALATAATPGSGVGTYAITQGTLGASGNYAITYAGANLTITPRPITVTADAKSRIYGNPNPALTYTIGGSGLYGGDALSGALATAAAQGSDVGSYAISQGTLAASSNYALTSTGATLSVTPRPITVAADAQSRAYGYGNPALTYHVGGDGLYGSDTLSGALATAAAAGSDVETYAITQGSLSAGSNYTLRYAGADLTVTPRAITVTADAQSRIYGDANPALTYSVGGSGLYGTDVLGGMLTTAATQSSNAGSYAITQGSLTAGDNYSLTYAAANLTVTPRAITVTADAQSRIYGNANPALTYTVGGSGLYGSDSLGGALATTAAQGSDVGSYAITRGTLGSSGNYSITYTGADLSIAARQITVAADTQTRIYGNANPALTYTIGGDGLYGSDTLSGALGTSATQGSNVGNYTITQGTLGTGGNYAVSYSGADLSITQRPITVSADPQSRIYGNANPALAYTIGGSGLYGTDTLAGMLATPATQDSNVGVYAIAQGTLAASSNYTLTYAGADLSITPRPITIAADAKSRVYGDANPVLTYAIGGYGLYGSDALSGALATTATQASNVGTYGVTQGTLSASGNYVVTFASATLGVTPRSISVAADNQTRPGGEANPPLTYRVSGLVNGDALTGALATSATVESIAGAYTITQGSLAASSNYQMQFTPGTLTVTENQQPSFAIIYSASTVLRDAVAEHWAQARKLPYELRDTPSPWKFSTAPICFSQAGCELSK
ncbi:MBG domain-containing protein [Sphingomonas sp. HF-S4]|uniref:MBG domain-containing protein n=1 Tax=Sphingomonas agrestis TaxID=3080540 RepID=A0ABU3Y468_9SPHN|nr:MBG domain-containing protein [Sphingomonas sp. HF-S4]MDV3455892.1 MBG domain-containing protein [Sphingomonas sp. HF-S4]